MAGAAFPARISGRHQGGVAGERPLGISPAGDGDVLGDPPPVAPHPLKRGGRAVVDRSREPEIVPRLPRHPLGSRRRFARPDATLHDELHQGVEIGTTRGNNEPEAICTRQEFGDSVRQVRGVSTRPVRAPVELGEPWP